MSIIISTLLVPARATVREAAEPYGNVWKHSSPSTTVSLGGVQRVALPPDLPSSQRDRWSFAAPFRCRPLIRRDLQEHRSSAWSTDSTGLHQQ